MGAILLLLCILLQALAIESVGPLIRAGSSLAFVRLCVTSSDYDECLQMSKVANQTISCVRARDKYECMKLIIDNEADIVNLNSEELYLAGRLYNLEPFAMEQYDGDTQYYKSVVIINNKANINSMSDLKGKRSCHGGLNSTHGWDIPIGLLLATMTMSPDCRGEMYSVSKFFDQSCAPGPWSSDSGIDMELKQLHSNLCAACQNSTLCSDTDEFAGDEGALKCLFSGYGQVAFTTSKTVERFLLSDKLDRLERRLMNNYVYLCLDGTKVPLDGKPCEWAHKPTNVFVTAGSRDKRDKEWFLSYLQQLFFRFVPYKPSWWRMKSLFSDPMHVTQILPVPTHLQRWDRYLGNFISSIEKPLPLCELNSVTMCTTSPEEELKCFDLQKAAFSQRLRPEIDCKRRASKQECLELIAKRQADLVAVDLSDLYEAPQAIVQQLEPVGVAQGFSDYAVAVVRADSGIKFLYQLGGRRSCHASFGDLASWLSPLSVLTERSLLDQASCNKADQMAEYFGGSCVPGAADLRVNHYRSGSDKLCAACRGDSEGVHQCERSSSERYHGQAGALRCLVEGAGEVAFVSLSSLAGNVDGRSQERWARNVPLALDSRNFRLVCRSGPSMPLGDYERCHLTKLPGKLMVGTKFTSKEDRLAIRQLLIRLVDKFATGTERDMFELFGPYLNKSDLMFDDSTRRIVPMKLEMSTFDMAIRLHFDPSYQQIPITNKDANCKIVLTTTSAAAAQSLISGSLYALVVLLNCLVCLMAIVSSSTLSQNLNLNHRYTSNQ
uniref:Transferrin n=1 Tax=Aceria tosichella TaxID=561515 RepID=A0A6G1SFP3_9ACAR